MLLTPHPPPAQAYHDSQYHESVIVDDALVEATPNSYRENGIAAARKQPQRPSTAGIARGRVIRRVSITTNSDESIVSASSASMTPRTAMPASKTTIQTTIRMNSSAARKRPQSARCMSMTSNYSSTSSSSSPSTHLISTLSSFTPTPSHLLRNKLQNASSLLHPTRSIHSIYTQNLPPQMLVHDEKEIDEATKEVRKRMMLLEEERKAQEEKHIWETRQQEKELNQLLQVQAQLKQTLLEREESEREEAASHAAMRKAIVKSVSPFAIASRMRALAARGKSVKQNSLFEHVEMRIRKEKSPIRRRIEHTKSSTLAPPSPSAAHPSTSAVSSAIASDPVQSLTLRKAYDLLRHTNEQKQREYDALLKELDTMILKVKTAESVREKKLMKEQQQQQMHHHHHHHHQSSSHDSSSINKSTSTVPNPLTLSFHQLHTRLEKLMLDYNETIRHQAELQATWRKMKQHEDGEGERMRLLERQIAQTDIEYEKYISYYELTHRTASSMTESVESLQHKMMKEKKEREKEIGKGRMMLMGGGGKKEEEKSSSTTTTSNDPLTIRINSSTPPPPSQPPSFFRQSTMSPMSHHNHRRQHSFGDPSDTPSSHHRRGKSVTFTAPVRELTFWETLTPEQQRLCTAWKRIEEHHVAVMTAAAAGQNGVMVSSSSMAAAASTTTPPSPPPPPIDYSLLISTLIDKYTTHRRLRETIDRKRERREEVRSVLREVKEERERIQQQSSEGQGEQTTQEDEPDNENNDNASSESHMHLLQRLHTSNNAYLQQAELYHRKQARLDTILNAVQQTVGAMTESVVKVLPSTVVATPLVQSRQLSATTSTTDSLKPPRPQHRRGGSNGSNNGSSWSSFSGSPLTSSTQSPLITVSEPSASVQTAYSSLVILHQRLIELVTVISPVWLPKHLREVQKEMKNATMLLTSQATSPSPASSTLNFPSSMPNLSLSAESTSKNSSRRPSIAPPPIHEEPDDEEEEPIFNQTDEEEQEEGHDEQQQEVSQNYAEESFEVHEEQQEQE